MCICQPRPTGDKETQDDFGQPLTQLQVQTPYQQQRNHPCTVEAGVVFFLDKIEETTRACDNLLLIWKTHGTPLGDRKVKETMHRTVSKILQEIEQWRENSCTEETLTSLTSIETFLEEINEMHLAILREEEDAATEFPSLLKLLIKKITISGTIP